MVSHRLLHGAWKWTSTSVCLPISSSKLSACSSKEPLPSKAAVGRASAAKRKTDKRDMRALPPWVARHHHKFSHAFTMARKCRPQVSVRPRDLEPDERLAGDGSGQRYARIKYEDGSELLGWVCSAEHVSKLEGQRVRIGVEKDIDGTTTPIIFWPPEKVYGKKDDVYNSHNIGDYHELCNQAAAHAMHADVFGPTERDGILGERKKAHAPNDAALARKRGKLMADVRVSKSAVAQLESAMTRRPDLVKNRDTWSKHQQSAWRKLCDGIGSHYGRGWSPVRHVPAFASLAENIDMMNIWLWEKDLTVIFHPKIRSAEKDRPLQTRVLQLSDGRPLGGPLGVFDEKALGTKVYDKQFYNMLDKGSRLAEAPHEPKSEVYRQMEQVLCHWVGQADFGPAPAATLAPSPPPPSPPASSPPAHAPPETANPSTQRSRKRPMASSSNERSRPAPRLDVAVAAEEAAGPVSVPGAAGPSGSSVPPVGTLFCVICQDAPNTMAVVPCGHKCLCEGCAELLGAQGRSSRSGKVPEAVSPPCPICRGPVQMVMKVHEAGSH